jgi:hypothetical protein
VIGDEYVGIGSDIGDTKKAHVLKREMRIVVEVEHHACESRLVVLVVREVTRHPEVKV